MRRVERDLDIQDRDVKVGLDSTKFTEIEKSTFRNRSDSESIFDSNIANQRESKVKIDEKTQTLEGTMNKPLEDTLEKPLENTKSSIPEKDVKLRDVGYDSDDVFANNPSSLMLAKFKVVRPHRAHNVSDSNKKQDDAGHNQSLMDHETQTQKNVKFNDKKHTLSKFMILNNAPI